VIGSQRRYDKLLARKQKAKTENDYRALAEELRLMDGYKDTIELADGCERKAQEIQGECEQKNRQKYEELLAEKAAALNWRDFKTLAEKFFLMDSYRDTLALANDCHKKAKKKRIEEELQNLLSERHKLEEQLRELGEEQHIQEKELARLERSQQWIKQGLCGNCGGGLAFLRKTCKNCGHKNTKKEDMLKKLTEESENVVAQISDIKENICETKNSIEDITEAKNEKVAESHKEIRPIPALSEWGLSFMDMKVPLEAGFVELRDRHFWNPPSAADWEQYYRRKEIIYDLYKLRDVSLITLEEYEERKEKLFAK
jgi:chromosome segregation ATPase